MAQNQNSPPIGSQVNRSKTTSNSPTDWKYGHLHRIDHIEHGSEELVSAINGYSNYVNSNRSGQQWAASIQHVENILFGAGRHYSDDLLVNRLTTSSDSENLAVVRETLDNIPKPVNDLLGRYVETNIALLTENRPMPRVTAKSEDIRDQKAAQLSELTLEYLWEALDLPEKHREIARLLMYCGTAWLEVCWDDTVPRRMTVPQTEDQPYQILNTEGGPVRVPIPTQVTKRNEAGEPILTDKVEFGDLAARIVSSFEMHLPSVHYWNGDDMGWVMREYYVPVDELKTKYGKAAKQRGNVFKKSNGWFIDNIERIQSENVTKLPLWWFERLAALVEGPGPSLYIGTPEQWDGYCIVRIFDRKPNETWERGRTIMVAGNQLIYDSPKTRGARAYDPRWPSRWHPYVRFRWEPMPASIYARALVSKLLPKLKRVNAIDTTMIMWRRTIPFSGWVAPKGSMNKKDLWSGRPGLIWEYDPRQTVGRAPEPIQPPSYPEAALREREQQIAEMEFIAGTEEILRGQKPQGVSSAAAIDMLRKQALASRSAILQAWDESLQVEGAAILQEVIKNVRKDPRYLERLRILAREKESRLTIQSFSGEDISDNVIVRIDTASQALLSKEAREAKTIEFLQFSSNLIALPMGLQQAILDRLGFEAALNPQGKDVERARRMIGWIKQGDFLRVVPMPEDNPFVFYELLVNETKEDGYWDLDNVQQQLLWATIDKYKQMIEFRMIQEQQLAAQQAQVQQGEAPGQPRPNPAQQGSRPQ